MWGIATYVFVLCAVSAGGDDQLSHHCERTVPGVETCLALYSGDPVPWGEARTRCGPGGDLASLTTESVRRTARALVTEAELGGGGYVWTAGRRSSDRTWRYLHSQTFRAELTGELPTQRYCGKFEFGRSAAVSDSCTKTANHRALCQYTPSAGRCQIADILMYDQCFHMSSEPMDWFQAWNYCGQYTTDCALSARILGGEQEFEDFVLDTSHGRDVATGMYFWLALTRLPWQWHTSTGAILVDHYDFGTIEGSDVLTSSCLALHSLGGAVVWDDRECSDQHRYYMCQSESQLSTVADRTTTDDVESVTAGSSNTTITSVASGNMSSTTMYIIIAVCVAAVIASVIVVVVIGIRSKPQSKGPTISKFAHLSNRNITKNDITIVHGLPDDIPDLTAPASPYAESDPGYSSVNNGATPVHSFGLTLDDPYAEIPGSAPSSEWDEHPDGDDFPPYSEPRDAVQDDSTCNEYSNLPHPRNVGSDSRHFMTELGEIYALPRKSITSMSDVIVDNPAYTSSV